MTINIRAPLFISLEIAYTCNNYCNGCINELSLSRQKTTPPAYWPQIIDAIDDSTALVRVTGGEPTLHPDIEKILTRLDEKQLKHVLFTHGRLENIKKVLPQLSRASHFMGSLVSLHGHTAEKHENFTRVKHSFRQTLDGIAAMVSHRLPFSTTTVIRDEVIDDLEAIVDFAMDLKAESIYFNRYLGIDYPGLITDTERLREAIRKIERLRAEKAYPIFIGNCIPQCFQEFEYPEFQINGFTACTIDPEGNVRPGHYPLILGNVLEQPLDAIWSGNPVAQYLNETPETCQNCVYSYTCPGGSRAFASKLGLVRDPHIAGPVQSRKKQEIYLDPRAKPVINPNTRIRKEAFGCIIYNTNTMYPLSLPPADFTDLLQSGVTVAALHDRYGNDVADLLAELYINGLISFTE